MKAVRLQFELEGGNDRPRWRFSGRTASKRQRRALALALCAAGFLCLPLAWQLRLLQADLTRAKASLQALTAQKNPDSRPVVVARPELSARDKAAWARVAGLLNTPWNAVFDTLERAIPDEVDVISIEPDAAATRFRLETQAPTLAALLHATSVLGSAEGVGSVALVKHDTQEQHAERAVRLVMDVQLKSAAP